MISFLSGLALGAYGMLIYVRPDVKDQHINKVKETTNKVKNVIERETNKWRNQTH